MNESKIVLVVKPTLTCPYLTLSFLTYTILTYTNLYCGNQMSPKKCPEALKPLDFARAEKDKSRP